MYDLWVHKQCARTFSFLKFLAVYSMREDESGAKNVLILLLLFDHSVIFPPPPLWKASVLAKVKCVCKTSQERWLYIRSEVNYFCRRPHPIWEIQFSPSASLFFWFCFCFSFFPFFLFPPSGQQTIVNTSCKSALVATVLEVLGP